MAVLLVVMPVDVLDISVFLEYANDDEPGLRSVTKGLLASAAAERILCVACRHAVTTAAERIEVQGRHEHAFANPHGLVFCIGCFRAAPGCTHPGGETADWTWFHDYTWRAAFCSNCRAHLGWLYEISGGTPFHGLILDRLIRENRDDAV